MVTVLKVLGFHGIIFMTACIYYFRVYIFSPILKGTLAYYYLIKLNYKSG